MTLLEIVKEYCLRTGLPVPLVGVTSGNTQIRQMIGLLNSLMEDLMILRVQWTGQQKEAAFTAIATSIQGRLTDLAPGFLWMINDSFFNMDTKTKLEGPIQPAAWQVRSQSSGESFRIRGGELLVHPTPPAGRNFSFEYVSGFGVVDGLSGAAKARFTRDSDTCMFSDAIILAGLSWIWKREKGLSYADELVVYEKLVQQLSGHDGSKTFLKLDGGSRAQVPGIFVPRGTWNVP